MERFDDEAEPEHPPTFAVWRGRLGTLGLVLVGLVVFELSANPSLGVAVACLKFALDDLRDAGWLRKSDPNRGRGRACFWIYLGVGFLRTSLIAFLGAVAMAIVAANFGEALGWPKRLLVAQLLGAVAVIVLGVLLASATTFLAVSFGLASRVKVWVGPEVRRARERGDWPPRLGEAVPQSRNRAGGVLLVLIPAAGFFAGLFAVGLLVTAIRLVGLNPAFIDGRVWALLCLGLMISGAIFGLSLRDKVVARLLARTAIECWPEAIAIVPRTPIPSEDDSL